MPITAERKAFYPKDWKAISLEVRERAGWVCEGSPAYPNCRAVGYEPHPVTGSKVILTVAHLDHDPANVDRANLKAWCQRCHLTYDATFHAENAAKTRRARSPQFDLVDMIAVAPQENDQDE
jgi:5-methylcytosine-specific restriction endonuclease McrA